MPGRRWSDGLHQAVEAKEGVKIEAREPDAGDRSRFQNYFRMYAKLAGMTGTAETEASEFANIYKLDRRRYSHQPGDGAQRPLRCDLPDRARKVRCRGSGDQRTCTRRDSRCWWERSPVENSEDSSPRSSRSFRVPHNVLNAKPEHARREADIIAQAGRKSRVTIATNMAGRGTEHPAGRQSRVSGKAVSEGEEINPEEAGEEQWNAALTRARKVTDAEHEEVVSLGGLAHSGHRTPRVEAHRQSVARAVGAPGRSGLVALLPFARRRSDAHLRRRAHQGPDASPRDGRGRADRIKTGVAAHRVRAEIGRGHNFSIRKHLLEYDDVMNKQREAVYGMRRQLLMGFEGDTPEEQNAESA